MNNNTISVLMIYFCFYLFGINEFKNQQIYPLRTTHYNLNHFTIYTYIYNLVCMVVCERTLIRYAQNQIGKVFENKVSNARGRSTLIFTNYINIKNITFQS